jgi:hypothetical protein
MRLNLSDADSSRQVLISTCPRVPYDSSCVSSKRFLRADYVAGFDRDFSTPERWEIHDGGMLAPSLSRISMYKDNFDGVCFCTVLGE